MVRAWIRLSPEEGEGRKKEQVKGCRGCPSHANGAERLCSGQLPSVRSRSGPLPVPYRRDFGRSRSLSCHAWFPVFTLWRDVQCVLASHARMSKPGVLCPLHHMLRDMVSAWSWGSWTQLGCLDRELLGPLPISASSERGLQTHATAPSFTWVWGSKVRLSFLTEPSPQSPSCRGDSW